MQISFLPILLTDDSARKDTYEIFAWNLLAVIEIIH